MSHLSDRFFAAVRVLAGDGPVKTRLITAYRDNLDTITDDDLPNGMQSRFRLLRQAMHAVKPLATESAIVASVRKMSSSDASRCATQIVAMYSELAQVAASKKARASSKADVDDSSAFPTPPRSALN